MNQKLSVAVNFKLTDLLYYIHLENPIKNGVGIALKEIWKTAFDVS